MLSFFLSTLSTQEPEEEQTSGALASLQMLSAQRNYPGTTLPAAAYFDAWEKSQEDRQLEKNNPPVGPWETMGPHNRGGRTLAITFNPQDLGTIYIGSASGGLWRTYTSGFGDQGSIPCHVLPRRQKWKLLLLHF